MSSTIRVCRYMVLLSAFFLYYGGRNLTAAVRWTCQDICGPSTDCGQACFYADDELTCGDYNGGQSNGECAENCSSACGSNVPCSTGCTGSGICGDYNGGQSNGECYGDCGDTTCQEGHESHATCPADCPGGGGGGGGCSGTCEDETCSECPQDCADNEEVCGFCGDLTCNYPVETGGYGSGMSNCDPDLDFWCSHCPEDCNGSCVPAACWPQVCGDPSGWKCVDCQEDSDCHSRDEDAWCSPYGLCTTTCDSNYWCNSGTHCDTNHHCVPNL